MKGAKTMSNEERKTLQDIDGQLRLLMEERMRLSASKGEGLSEAENAAVLLADRKYERELLFGIKADDTAMENCERTFFRTVFNISHTYAAGTGARPSDIKEKIGKALAGTSKIFPESALVACQGIEGAYSQLACDKLFKACDIMYFRTFDGVFSAVENGLCRYGILPIENSSFGSVTQVYDLMKTHSFHIVKTLKYQITHRLLARKGTKMEDIKEIVSHEQALGQCSRFLKDNKNIKVTVVANTAVAARMVAESDRTDLAAISSPDCAALYDLAVINDRIQNTDHNFTRFICISKDLEIYPGADRASMMISLGHTPGSLANTLARFSSLGLNLTKIESRPISGRDFEFMFYLDVEASVYSDAFVTLLSQLDSSSEEFTFLGNYSEV